MADKRLVDYLKLGKKRGIQFEVLKKSLLKKGYPPSAVDEAAKEANFWNSSHSYIIILIGLVLVLTLVVVMNLGNMAETQPKKIEEPGKKTETAQKQLTNEEQLSTINKVLSEKYSNYKIKNYGEVAYDKELVLRAEVDLGYIDVCSQKIKADSAVFVIKDNKLIPTPLAEIKNKASKFGEIIPEKTGEIVTEIKNTNKKTSDNCELKDFYQVFVKLDEPYAKTISGINDFEVSSEQAPPKPATSKPSAPPAGGQSSSTLKPTMPFGDISVTHKTLLIDQIGNMVYSYEGIEYNKNIITLKGEFA